MAKIDRKYLAHYISVSKDGDGTYERLGQDLEEFSPEMSAQVETKKNILGEASIMISGYEKTASVEPFYADKDSALFNRLQEIIDDNLALDELKAYIVDVKLWDEASSGAYPAVKETVFIEVTSYGGDTVGYKIPFTLHYTGDREKGTFNVSTKTFTKT